jgi:hypothetical protein
MPLENQNDIGVLFPGRVVKIANGEVRVSPFMFQDIPKVLALIAKYPQFFKPGAPIDAQKLIIEGWKDVLELLALGLRVQPEWFNDLAAEDGFALLDAVLEENIDFFTKHVMPLMNKWVGKAVSAGQTGLQDSLPTATASRMLEPTH